MLLKLLTSIPVALALATSPALACKGVNKLLEEDFSNPETAWVEQLPTMVIKNGKLTLSTEPLLHSSTSYEGEFFNDGDFCVTVTAPDVKDDSVGMAGVMFYLTNEYEFYAFLINPAEGKAGIIRMSNGEFLFPVPARRAVGMNLGGKSVNTLRVTWKDGAVTSYVNDKLFAQLKAKPPRNGKIGLYAESAGATWSFSNVLVTDPPRIGASVIIEPQTSARALMDRRVAGSRAVGSLPAPAQQQ
jgi:hypothetical protein